MDYAARRAALQTLTGTDAIAIVPGANMHYFTGLDFHLSERPIIALFTQTDTAFIIPQLEVPQLTRQPDLEPRLFVWTDAEGYEGAFNAAVEALGLRGGLLGVDEANMRVFEWLAFEQADPTLRLRSLGQALRGIRSHKTADEVAAMQQAITLSEAALEKLVAWVTPGKTEREIAAQLDALLVEAGSQGLAFGSLVQTGPNSALPHGGVTDRAVGVGEFLLIDFGGRYAHYPADITRTFCVGAPSEDMRRIYDAVLRANRAALAVTRPGVPCGAVDQAARAVIEEAGYGEYFIHRTGHGLGLEGHELPQVAPGVEDVLEEGMVFTIEPGVYVPGVGGVRIEDDVLVTADGARELTSFPRELRVL